MEHNKETEKALEYVHKNRFSSSSINEKLNNLSLRTILLSIAGGIWMLVLQNLGIIPITQNVHIKGGTITDIENNVGVRGNVNVDGNVRVNNTVDINIHEINGQKAFYKKPSDDGYYRLPIAN